MTSVPGTETTAGVAAGSATMYSELARWWPLLSPPQDYAEEAALYERLLLEACEVEPQTLLELGSGGGNNAFYLKRRFRAVLVDLSREMLEVSGRLNPECEHVQGDMRTVRLGRDFDCVFVHDAVSYMTTEAELRAAIRTAYLHCRPGGAAVFAPDQIRDTFKPTTDHGGTDHGGEGLRYLEWTHDPDPTDTTVVVEYALLVRSPDGSVRGYHDRHLNGLFSRAEWIRFLSEAGFDARAVPFEHSAVEPGTMETFVGRKPVARS
jgi:SAM-dependent methyltransferase